MKANPRKVYKNRLDRMVILLCNRAGIEFPTPEIADEVYRQMKARYGY